MFNVPDIAYDNLVFYSSKTKSLNNLLSKITEVVSKDMKDETGKIIRMSLDVILDSISVLGTLESFLIKNGIIFMPIFRAVECFPCLVISYFGSCVGMFDNYFSIINSIMFVGGSFCYVPQYYVCDVNLSTYFMTRMEEFAQFERTLIVVEDYSFLSYIEGCSAPVFIESQLHIALVEVIVKKFGEVNYSTVQN